MADAKKDTNRIVFRADTDLLAWLEGRADRTHAFPSPSLQAKAELDLWRTVLQMELRRFPLTLAEASCLADVLNGHLPSPGVSSGIGIVYAECADAFALARNTPLPGESSYAAKWGIEEKDLLERLERLGPAADMALSDAFARWWAADHEPTPEGFTAVGLRVRHGGLDNAPA